MYATAGLLDALLAIAADRDPSKVTVSLAVTSGEALDVDLPPDASVFTDFYHPDTGGSVRAVFGMDLGTPSAAGRFVSHPDGTARVTREDDLHEVVFVAVPPYDRGSVAVFDRSGRALPLEVLDVEPPEPAFDD